eukprot:838672-Pelagomonas_calceolata.AAC.1
MQAVMPVLSKLHPQQDIKGILGYGNWSRQPQGHASGELISNCANIHTWQWMAKALTPSPDTAAQKQWTMSADYEFAATSKVYKLKDIHVLAVRCGDEVSKSRLLLGPLPCMTIDAESKFHRGCCNKGDKYTKAGGKV